MSKTHKVLILLLLAVICAVVAGFSIYSYCNASKGFIYAFKNDYPAGTKISKDMFYSIKVDDTIITSGQKAGLETYYITGESFEKVIKGNEYLLNDVIKNQPLTFVDLALTSGTSIERSLSGDYMAVTIPISGSAAVTDKLRVGSVVNIFKTDSYETRLIFENMKVIARNKGDNLSSVTFEVTPDDTLDLINAANNYRLYFALAKPVLDENAHSGYVKPDDSSEAPEFDNSSFDAEDEMPENNGGDSVE